MSLEEAYREVKNRRKMVKMKSFRYKLAKQLWNISKSTNLTYIIKDVEISMITQYAPILIVMFLRFLNLILNKKLLTIEAY
jgi:hypothetical protein